MIYHAYKQSVKYDLANGEEIAITTFRASQTNDFLQDRGFHIEMKPERYLIPSR